MKTWQVTHHDSLEETISAESAIDAAKVAICQRLARTLQESPIDHFPGGTYFATVKTETGVKMFRVDFDARRQGKDGLMEYPFSVREEALE